MQEKTMTEAESISLITSMINKAKNRFTESGTLYILWGWLLLACCTVQFVGLHFLHYERVYYVWYTTWPLLIYQFFYLSKRKKRQNVRMYTSEIIMWVWIVFMVTYALLIFILIYNKAFSCINPTILAAYGMPTFLVGIILKFNPLKIGGICCWLLTVAAPFADYDYQFVLMALAVIIVWIIPGYIFQQKFKNAT